MKIFIINILAVCVFWTLLSCEDGDIEAPKPCLETEVQVQQDGQNVFVSATSVAVGEEMNFSSCGKSTYAVIYPGDANHVLPVSENDTTNYGFPMTQGVRFAYTYPTAGVYTATLLVTNVSSYSTSKKREIIRRSTDIVITVTE